VGADLNFREDGTFTIVQFTDMHIGNTDSDSAKEREKDRKTIALIEQVIELEKPDLIVHTGDLIWSHGILDPRKSFRRAISPAVNSNVPWAAVFGNHDAEEGVTREELLAIQLESDSCYSQAGPAEINGVGNYRLMIKNADNSENAAALYFLDSGSDAPEPIGGYAWIQSDQVNWYREQASLCSEEHGSPLPALAFFHIPLPEYDEVWKKGKVSGFKNENVCCAKLNSGLFTTMVEAGDVMGTFVGHDHDNDYCAILHGIRLCYGRVTGYNTYGKLPRGARVIRLFAEQHHFDTWLRLDNGEVL
jgi:hypothetical protein